MALGSRSLLARTASRTSSTNLSYLPEQIREVFGDGSGFGLAVRYSEEPEPARHRGRSRQGPRLPLRDGFLPDHLGRRSHRHRPERDARGARGQRRARRRSPPWRPSGSPTRRSSGSRSPATTAAFRDSRRSPSPPRRSPIWPTAASTCSARRSSITSRPLTRRARRGTTTSLRGFVDWAMDVFPALLDGDIPFYSHEIDAYWNDVGSVGEFVQGNLDALTGAVGVDPPSGSGLRGRLRRRGLRPRRCQGQAPGSDRARLPGRGGSEPPWSRGGRRRMPPRGRGDAARLRRAAGRRGPGGGAGRRRPLRGRAGPASRLSHACSSRITSSAQGLSPSPS